MKTHHFFCILSIFLLSSCGLFKDDEGPFNPLSEEFKSYVYFPAGSYWIYKELNSGRIDSSYILHNNIYVEHWPKTDGGPEQYEHMAVGLVREVIPGQKDTIGGEGFSFPLSSQSTYFNGQVRYIYYETIYKYGVARHPYFATPIDTANDGSSLEPDILTVHDSVEVQGTWYKDVFITLHGNPGDIEGNNPIRSETYAKDVGVIRREYFDGRVYELLRYHINH